MSTKQKQQMPQIMGVLNVTPDSFSDGGEFNKPADAIDRALTLKEQGASIVDIGGESTRPGAAEVSMQQQIDRVIPVIEGIRKRDADLLLSVDTTDYTVAKTALGAGANWINDISAGEASDAMLSLAAKKNVPIVLMHRLDKSDRMQDNPQYDDVLAEVTAYLKQRAELALQTGVKSEHIILDPGIGFGKTLQHNLQLLAGLETLVALGFQVLLGTSRKRFIGEITGENDPHKRVSGTCATTALGVHAGVQFFRVHDVVENKQSMDIAWAIKQA